MIQHIKKNRAQYFLFLFLIILIAVMSALAPGKFLTVRNFKNMGFQMAEFGILAIGMSVVIMTGGINLSLVNSAMLAAIVGSFVMRALYKLQSSGNFDKEKLLGREATVYVSIAPNRGGRGKITLTAQGAYTELDAVTDEDTRIAVDERVIISEIGADYMVVRRVSSKPDVPPAEPESENGEKNFPQESEK